MNASFEERSVWIQLVSVLFVTVGYFFVAGQMLSVGVTSLVSFVPVFAVSITMMVIVIIFGHVVVALASRPDKPDERDRLIGWRAESHSAWIVVTGVLAGISGMVLSLPNVWVAHLMLLSLFLSELLKLVLKLVYYRRGI